MADPDDPVRTPSEQSAAVLLGGRITTSSLDCAVKEMRHMVDALNDAGLSEVMVFVSENEAVHDAAFTAGFCERLGVDRARQTAVGPTPTPPEAFAYPKAAETNVARCWSMYAHNRKAFVLMEAEESRRGRPFGVVIKYRADLREAAPGQYARLGAIAIHTARYGGLFIPAGYDWGGVNDQVAVGGRAEMATYCACSDSILALCSRGVLFHPETLLMHHLQATGVLVDRFAFAYQIWR